MAEDDPVSAKVLQDALSKFGYEPIARGGVEAWDKFNQEANCSASFFPEAQECSSPQGAAARFQRPERAVYFGWTPSERHYDIRRARFTLSSSYGARIRNEKVTPLSPDTQFYACRPTSTSAR